MSIWKKLFPPANRQAAAVAWIRTFWQTIRGTSYLGGAGAIVFNAADIQHINLTVLGWIVAAVVSTAVLTASLSAGDILVHGLPSAYTDAPAVAGKAADGAYNVSSLPAAAAPVVTRSFDEIVAGASSTPVVAQPDQSASVHPATGDVTAPSDATAPTPGTPTA